MFTLIGPKVCSNPSPETTIRCLAGLVHSCHRDNGAYFSCHRHQYSVGEGMDQFGRWCIGAVPCIVSQKHVSNAWVETLLWCVFLGYNGWNCCSASSAELVHSFSYLEADWDLTCQDHAGPECQKSIVFRCCLHLLYNQYSVIQKSHFWDKDQKTFWAFMLRSTISPNSSARKPSLGELALCIYHYLRQNSRNYSKNIHQLRASISSHLVHRSAARWNICNKRLAWCSKSICPIVHIQGTLQPSNVHILPY